MTSEPPCLRVSLASRGLCVHLPSGRRIEISALGIGARFIEDLLRGMDQPVARKRFIGAFPTQEVADIWERMERQKEAIAAQAETIRKEAAAAKPKRAIANIDASKIIIDL